MRNDCKKDPPKEFLHAIEQFNKEELYECHETLEDLWRNEKGEIRKLFKGILQIGVGVYHARKSNLKGALRLISSGMELMKPFTPSCFGIDVSLFLQATEQMKDELEKMGPGEFLSPDLIPKIMRSA